MEAKKIVPDTSVIIDGRITELIKKQKQETEIIIPQAVVSELEYQANQGRETGFEGLQELKLLREYEKEGKIKLSFHGMRAEPKDAKHHKTGRTDEIIRDIAEEKQATLLTSDYVQSLVAEAKGLAVEYIEPKVRVIEPEVFKLLDDTTMSLHLKENTPAYAKKGSVGNFKLIQVGDTTDREKLDQHAKEIVEYTKSDPRGYIELEQKGATVIQLGKYRIVIARPPFSDGLEITIVKPLVKTTLEDYDMTEKLLARLYSHAEGIFVAGAPGAGKSTFVQALAESYQNRGKIVKTMEHPRDLQLIDEITQYGPLEGSMEKTGDLLLLVRPDYTIFDELRKTSDFRVFADMRLAGVGMIGVTHASKAIDAIQRLIGRVDLGLIPHIVDTLIHLEAGKIKNVYELRMTVKVPCGMMEADLARPVVEVRDFESGAPEYELYTFGEEVVVVPVKKRRPPSPDAEYVGEGGEEASVSQTKKQLILHSNKIKSRRVEIYVGGEYITAGRANQSGVIKIRKNSGQGRYLSNAAAQGKKITIK